MAWNRLSLSQILKTANLVLVVTPEEKETKLKMGADPKKCFLFSSGVNEEPFLRYAASDTKDFARRHDISEGARIVSYLGSLEERKNPMSVLKIAKLFKGRSDIHFIIAGRGETRYAKRVREEASQRRYELELGRKLAVDEYIEKPIEPFVLLQRVEKLLSKGGKDAKTS